MSLKPSHHIRGPTEPIDPFNSPRPTENPPKMAPHGDADRYHPVDAVKAGIQGAMITGAAGLFAASVRNATRRENVGALGVFTRSGGLILTFCTRLTLLLPVNRACPAAC